METNRQLAKWRTVGIVIGFAAGVALSAQTAAPAATSQERIGIEAFRTLHASGGVYVIDVRGAEAFAAGHIPGAINVPMGEIEARAGEIRKQAGARTIVTYCSCPEEHASLAAVRLLAAKAVIGARALVGGYPAWVARENSLQHEAHEAHEG